MHRIVDVAARLGLTEDDLIPYGRDKAKVDLSVLDRPRPRPGKAHLVLVSAITPTPAGEGKTTTSIGLSQALDRLGEHVCVALREPSLGPCFGVKGGGCGGGKSTIEPSVQINLHFNGDLHAVTAAHNLLSAMIDNHLHFKSEPRFDARRVTWKRALDVNDRSLRNIVLGLGGSTQGVPREAGFDITAASEVMAVLCLAKDKDDLRARLGRLTVAIGPKGRITADDIKATGAMLALLWDALRPNLVATTEGTPAIVHGGPFANIAHGCNSVLATRMAMHLSDWVITEAGFGFDLGAEKFLDIKCAGNGLAPEAVVVVATIRALKMHGGTALADLETPDAGAVSRGLPNLEKHLETARAFGLPPVVALNRFPADTAEEIAVVRARCAELGVRFAEAEHFAKGGAGAEELARQVMAAVASGEADFRPLYDWSAPVKHKIHTVATTVYGARGVVYSKEAEAQIARIERGGLGNLPICMAKTQSSLTDDPKQPGRPTDFDINVRGLEINTGAGFLVVLTGDMMRMPGLPRVPQAVNVDVVEGEIIGIE